MRCEGREVSKQEALRIAADMDIKNDGIVNGFEAFQYSECDGFVTYRRWDVTPHFQHRPHYPGRRHTPR